MSKEKQLKEKILEWGAAKVGFADLTDLLPEEYSHLQTGIAIAIRLSDEIIHQIQDRPTHTYFHHYRTVNGFIDQVTLKISAVLQEDGYLAMAIPASQSVNIDGKKFEAIFPHKTVATRAGLGWIGKSACLITEEFGPRVRLGTVLTNWKPIYDSPINESKCGTCSRCVENCPALAIQGSQWELGLAREELFDARACSTHMHQHYQHIGRGSVCGICIRSCPVGKRIIKR